MPVREEQQGDRQQLVQPAHHRGLHEHLRVEGDGHLETTDGVELEDWVYGLPPGKITFVTFKGDKVVTVKEEYAGLGNIAQSPPQ